MSCDIVEPQYCSMHSEKLSSSELRGIIPTPGLPGEVETYYAYNAGGKNEILTEHMDTISVEFTDKQGNYFLNLHDFVVVLIAVTISANKLGRFAIYQLKHPAVSRFIGDTVES